MSKNMLKSFIISVFMSCMVLSSAMHGMQHAVADLKPYNDRYELKSHFKVAGLSGQICKHIVPSLTHGAYYGFMGACIGGVVGSLMTTLVCNQQQKDPTKKPLIHIGIVGGACAGALWKSGAISLYRKKRFHNKVHGINVFGAAATDNIEILNLWIAHEGISILSKKDASGRTPLHYAAANKSEKVMQTILAYGISSDILDMQDIVSKRTALHYAELRDSASLCTLLLHAGANPEVLDYLGNRVSHSQNHEIADRCKQHKQHIVHEQKRAFYGHVDDGRGIPDVNL